MNDGLAQENVRKADAARTDDATLTVDDVRMLLRQLIEERYESQAQAARIWKMRKQNLNDILQGRRPIPDVLIAKLGLEPVTMYRKS